jgi:hypothetical protein
MTTILILNAVSSLTAGIGIGGFLVWKNRQARERALAEAVYLPRGR